jgi:predicted flavoprotein YhiN
MGYDSHAISALTTGCLHLWRALAERRKLSELKKAERQELVKRLTAYELPYTGHEGYKKAEVGC